MTLSGFDWDQGNWPKCRKHGLSKEEIEHALRHAPLVLPALTGRGTETRFNAVGINVEGRHVFVVFTIRRKGKQQLVRPISARYMHAKEIRVYDKTKATQEIPSARD